jgi:hypothetical protein
MSLFIMAAGKQSRWRNLTPPDFPKSKLLANLHGKILIYWTTDQLKLRNKRFQLITKDIVGNTSSICHSILSTQSLWKGTVYFLCGDVVWSDSALDNVLSCTELMFFGNKAEIFALVVPKLHQGSIINYLSTTITNSKGRLCDLRHLVSLGTFSPDLSEELSRKLDPLFTFIKDWTSDIDHYAAYQRFIKIQSAKEELLSRPR